MNKTLKINQNTIKILSKENEELKELNKANSKSKPKNNSSNQINQLSKVILDYEFLEKFKMYEEAYQNIISIHFDEEKLQCNFSFI